MPDFRTASGLIAATPYLRTAGGPVECGALFFGQLGPVESGSPDPLAASADPTNVYGATNVGHPIQTNVSTVTATGGKPPYAYAWADFPDFTIVNPTSVMTGFIAPPFFSPDSISNTGSCTVTDAKGDTVAVPVTATAERF